MIAKLVTIYTVSIEKLTCDVHVNPNHENDRIMPYNFAVAKRINYYNNRKAQSKVTLW